ncbi:hypothetical protein H0H87_000532, partial [Tephrocybe sp. NHM501043]
YLLQTSSDSAQLLQVASPEGLMASSSYIGCYNDTPTATSLSAVPPYSHHTNVAYSGGIATPNSPIPTTFTSHATLQRPVPRRASSSYCSSYHTQNDPKTLDNGPTEEQLNVLIATVESLNRHYHMNNVEPVRV